MKRREVTVVAEVEEGVTVTTRTVIDRLHGVTYVRVTRGEGWDATVVSEERTYSRPWSHPFPLQRPMLPDETEEEALRALAAKAAQWTPEELASWELEGSSDE